MFPNYCFKKRAGDFSYDVMYTPKNSYEGGSHQCNHPHYPHSHSRSRQRTRSKLCYENLLSMQALQEANERIHMSQQTNNNKQKSGPAKPGRNVEFRLPAVEQFSNGNTMLPLRTSGGMESANREYHRQQQLQRESSHHSDIPSSSSDTNHATKESCADFFNIICENVLEAVHGAVDDMVKKNFQDIILKIGHLTEQLSLQETLLKQINCDLMTKIAEQNQTSISQFKFIAQMLIDSQTIHYKTLNQQRFLRQKISGSQENQNQIDSQDRLQGAQENSAPSQNSNTQKQQHQPQEQPQLRPQHQLWQQQDFSSPPKTSVCKNCNHQKSQLRAERKPSVLRRSCKGTSTASMPDLYRATMASTFNKNNTNRSKMQLHSPPPPTLASFGTSRSSNQGHSTSCRKCRCICSSTARPLGSNYGLSNASLSRRTYRSPSKTMPSLEDVRLHR